MNVFDEELMTIKNYLKEYTYEKNQQESFFSKLFSNDKEDKNDIEDIVMKNSKAFKVRANIINLRSKIAVSKSSKINYKCTEAD